MNHSGDRSVSRMLSECCAAISRYQIQKEVDTTVSIYDGEDSLSPLCSHHRKGSWRFPLWKVGVFLGICIAFCTLMHGIASLFSDS